MSSPPSPPPPTLVQVITTVSFDTVIGGINLVDLTGNSTFYASFNETYKSSLAESANVSQSDVEITRVSQGSLVVGTEVVFSEFVDNPDSNTQNAGAIALTSNRECITLRYFATF